MESLLFTVTGPATNFVISDGIPGGEQMTYAATIPAGQGMSINAGTWQVLGFGGYVPDIARLSFGGRRFLTIRPARPTQVPLWGVFAQSVTVDTAFTVSGRESFLL